MGETIYRGYDREALDQQLNLRARWPEHQGHFDRWARDSTAARATLEARLDLAYGPTDGQKLDFFEARGAQKAPLLAFIHGGYWQSLDKGDFSYLAPGFVEQGIAFASLNYDLAPSVSMTQITGQIYAALAWLWRAADKLNIDAGRIFVAGHSAGGHLAVMALTTGWAQRDNLPRDLVKGACSVSGVYDLKPIRLSYHQDILNLEPDEVEAWSPVRNLPSSAGPLIGAVGSAETEEFRQQQEEYFAAWQERGLSGRTIDLPNRNHFTAIDALGEPDHPLYQALCGLVLSGDL